MIFLSIQKNRGFSLLELMIVISIVIIISGIVIFDYAKFRSRTALNLVAEEVAVTIREAQVYGIGVRGQSSDNISFDFDAPYSVYVNPNTHPNQVLLYSEQSPVSTELSSGYNYYNNPADILLQTIRLQTPIRLLDICLDQDGNPGGEICGLERLNVRFQRPDPEPFVAGKKSVVSYEAAYGRISITDGQSIRNIYIWNTGQISVQ